LAPSAPPARRSRVAPEHCHLDGRRQPYRGLHRLFGSAETLLRRFGDETTFVQPGDDDGWRGGSYNTKLFFGDRGQLDVLDDIRYAHCHEAGVPLLVDSTLTSPWLIKLPFEHGADLVLPLGDQVLSGHGARSLALGGGWRLF
jgi:O-acetylhomoserine/O-acetylserine sulfhydrylase-like pyridoxal-dependent enzyme